MKVVMGRRVIFAKFFFILKTFTGYIERWFDQPALFLRKSRTFMLKGQKRLQKDLLTKRSRYSKRFLWTYNKQFRKSCFKHFAKKPKTDITKYEKIYKENFLSKTSNFPQNVLLETLKPVLKTLPKKIAESPRTFGPQFEDFFGILVFPKTFTRILWTNRMQFWRP